MIKQGRYPNSASSFHSLLQIEQDRRYRREWSGDIEAVHRVSYPGCTPDTRLNTDAYGAFIYRVVERKYHDGGTRSVEHGSGSHAAGPCGVHPQRGKLAARRFCVHDRTNEKSSEWNTLERDAHASIVIQREWPSHQTRRYSAAGRAGPGTTVTRNNRLLCSFVTRDNEDGKFTNDVSKLSVQVFIVRIVKVFDKLTDAFIGIWVVRRL